MHLHMHLGFLNQGLFLLREHSNKVGKWPGSQGAFLQWSDRVTGHFSEKGEGRRKRHKSNLNHDKTKNYYKILPNSDSHTPPQNRHCDFITKSSFVLSFSQKCLWGVLQTLKGCKVHISFFFLFFLTCKHITGVLKVSKTNFNLFFFKGTF